MIRIIKGTYGYVDKDGIVKPKTAKDEPFSINDFRDGEGNLVKGSDAELRLVDQGVAVKVESEKKAAPEPVKADEPVKDAKPGKKSNKKKSEETNDEPPVLEAADPE